MFKHLPRSSFIENYFQRTKSYSDVRFIFELVALTFCLNIILFSLVSLLFDLDGTGNTALVDEGSLGDLFVSVVVVGPIVETLFDQWLPIKIASFFTPHLGDLLILSSLYFAAQHLYFGLRGFLGLLPLGIFLSWSFLVKREISLWKAFWVTTLIHSLYNLVILFIYVPIRNIP